MHPKQNFRGAIDIDIAGLPHGFKVAGNRIEQYKKNHADELPPDVWKAQTLARLQKQSRARVDRLNQRIVVGISLLIGLFLIIWLVSMIAA